MTSGGAAPLPSVTRFEEALVSYQRAFPGEGYFLSRQRFVATYELLRDFYPGGPILDLGAWPGDFCCAIASVGIPVSAVDKDPARPTGKRLDTATGAHILTGVASFAEKCSRYGLECVQCDIERESIPLQSGSVGAVMCTEVLAHLRTGLLHALRECRRILRPGGRLLITTPNLLSLRNRVSFVFAQRTFEGLSSPYEALIAEERIGHGGMYRTFAMWELVELLENTGFQIRYTGYRHLLTSDVRTGLSPGSLRRWIRDELSRRISPFGNALFVVAEAQ